MRTRLLILAGLLSGLLSSAYAAVSPDVAEVRTEWETIKYRLPEEAREAAFERLASRAAQVSAAHPGRAEQIGRAHV